MYKYLLAGCGIVLLVILEQWGHTEFTVYREVIGAVLVALLVGPWIVKQFDS